MSDRGRIVFGLTAFVALAAFPVWHAVTSPEEAGRPELELPTDATACVEDTDYMTAHHMDLLDRWRNAVVRDGDAEYLASSGERYTMSLTGTCLDCHGDRDGFCTRCHEWANVAPTCWNCHVDPIAERP